jgi:hypothetical protein
MNVTVTNTTGPPSFLTVYPTGASRPLASNLNYQPGVTVANLVVVPVSQSGFVTAYNNLGSADVIFDLEGLFKTPGSGPAGLLRPLSPSRILDTRTATRTGACTPSPCATLGPHGRLDLQVAGSTGSDGSPSGVPASGAEGVVLNVTATNPSGPVSYLSVFPSGQTTPDPTSSSDLNFVASQTVPNRVMVPLGTAGQVGIYNNQGTVDVAVDVVGYFTDTTGTGTAGVYTALAPVRVLDSRSNTGNCSGGPCSTLGPQSQLTLQLAGSDGVPTVTSGSPSAVILNVTATSGSTTSFLTAYPAGSARPLASDLNWVAGQTIPNLTPAKLSNGGAVTFFNNLGSVDVVADLEGWFS